MAAFTASASAAHADTQYAGTGAKGTKPRTPLLSLTAHDDGRVTGRVSFAYRCHGLLNYNLIARVSGRANGAAFTLTGKTRLGSRKIRFTVTGTLAPDAATGTIRLRARGCRGYANPFTLRTPSAPGGVPTKPAPNQLMLGMSSQSAGGAAMPVYARVTNAGRVYVVYAAWLSCGRAHFQRVTVSGSMKVKADGTFHSAGAYTLRFVKGPSERVHIKLRGQFLADGVKGTLNVRSTARGYRPCTSGTQTWAARA